MKSLHGWMWIQTACTFRRPGIMDMVDMMYLNPTFRIKCNFPNQKIWGSL